MSEKTEKPTAKKLRDAREKGQVAKSQEINATVQIGVILLWLIATGPSLQQGLTDTITATLDAVNLPLHTAMNQITGRIALLMMHFIFTLAGILVVSITLIGMLQTGFLFAPGALKVSADKINPISNLKNMFSMRSLFDLVKMLFKVSVLGLTFAYLIKRYAASFAHLPQAPIVTGMAVCVQLAQWMWMILLAVTAVFSIADYAVQHRQTMKQLMMSREDIKQEYKNSEGNPEIKHRRREMHREVQSGSLAGKVAKSSVVVRNPTHIAVCLHYAAEETPLPMVLEYGRGARALHIVALAEAHGIPVVEHIPLARALIRYTQPGDYIPESLLEPVAQVLGMIQKQLAQQDEGEDDDAEA
ncbi:EscU/YscU/HrcU family type III secretion system export apparatus switch protein [Dyella sp. M7H15-1]|uniref:EscU/YscU/HrcU family type III secretion system export apparatus switch protein n=1 Tax=Dyella sp. M7H15-1 TaxID=2501295 RepID=UPI001005053A|nr:EscU/YscU/HrcU family type III secretion system export apparatus switch protein [Dyella sp. M7H15-1]QAU24839.1 EscU/YscU/HrcU family type III secretion system export apparatus switch protein [Dyella sp. M7H15-1]